MEDQNIILFLDKIKKMLELGNKPKAIEEIEHLEYLLAKQMSKKKGKLFELIHIPSMTDTERENPLLQRVFEVAHKTNEIANFLNNRHPVN